MPAAQPPDLPSEDRDDGVEASSTPPSDDHVLARGHLHPSVLLLRLIDAGRRVAFLVILAIFEPRFLIAVLGLFVLQLTFGWNLVSASIDRQNFTYAGAATTASLLVPPLILPLQLFISKNTNGLQKWDQAQEYFGQLLKLLHRLIT